MKTSRTLVKLLSLALAFAMMFTLVSCDLFGGSLKLESFTVDRSTVKTSYYIGDQIDFSGIKAYAKYSDASLDKEYTASELTITYAKDITATEGQKEVKVSFQDPHLNVEQSTTVLISVTTDPNKVVHESYKLVVPTGFKTDYLVGETVDTTGLKLVEVMSDKTEKEVTDHTGLTFTPDLSSLTATAGNHEVTATYNGEAVTGSVIFRVIDPDDNKNSVTGVSVSGTYKTTYELGETLDLAGIVVTVTYKDGTTVELGATDLTPGEVDMTTAGTKTVRINFTDANGEDNFTTFTITVVKKDFVDAFTENDAITAFKTNNANAGKTGAGNSGFAGEFAVGNKTYQIGDDNAFTMVPTLRILEDGITSDAVAKYYMDVDLFIDRGEGYVLLEKTATSATIYTYAFNGTTVATVDTYNGVYNFNELDGAPLGKIKISVLPSADYYTGDNAKTPVVLEAEVIDAYNVTEAWQLALIDNQEFVGYAEKSKWLEFKTEHGLAGVQVNGIVIHNNIRVTADDIPESFLYTTTKEITELKVVGGKIEETKIIPVGTKYIENNVFVYDHHTTAFTMHGNFFNLDFSAFPLVASPSVISGTGYENYGARGSLTSLFRFKNDYWSEELGYVPMSVENAMFIGNAPRNNWVVDGGAGAESKELVSLGGAILFKVEMYVDTTFDNVLNNSFYTTYGIEWDGMMTITNSKCFDSFQNAVTATRGVYCKIENSHFQGTGGPVIIAQGGEHENIPEYPVVETVNTVLDTHLVGDELWFSALGEDADEMVNGIKGLSAVLQANGLGSYLNAEGKMNIKAVLLYDGGFGNAAAEGSVNVNGTVSNKYHSNTHWMNILTHPAFAQAAPFFTVCVGGDQYSIFYSGQGTVVCDLLGNPLSGDALAQYATLFAGNDIVLTQGGLSVILEFYH